MKKLLLGTCLLATPAFAEGELKVYHWFEYIPEELVQKFETETGIDVTIDTFDSNEAMLAALKAGKMGQYDVAVPGDYMVKIMGGRGAAGHVRAGRPAELRQHRSAMGRRPLRSGPQVLDPLPVGLDRVQRQPRRLSG